MSAAAVSKYLQKSGDELQSIMMRQIGAALYLKKEHSQSFLIFIERDL